MLPFLKPFHGQHQTDHLRRTRWTTRHRATATDPDHPARAAVRLHPTAEATDADLVNNVSPILRTVMVANPAAGIDHRAAEVEAEAVADTMTTVVATQAAHPVVAGTPESRMDGPGTKTRTQTEARRRVAALFMKIATSRVRVVVEVVVVVAAGIAVVQVVGVAVETTGVEEVPAVRTRLPLLRTLAARPTIVVRRGRPTGEELRSMSAPEAEATRWIARGFSHGGTEWRRE